jgi:Tol biopolymer transport system component
MHTQRFLLLFAALPLIGCDSVRNLMRTTSTEPGYAPALANDTSVVTTRRVMTMTRSSQVDVSFSYPMPDGNTVAVTDWNTGDPAILDLDSQEIRRLALNSAPYAEGIAMSMLPTPDGRRLAHSWQVVTTPTSSSTARMEIRITDVATAASRTVMAIDTPIMAWLQALGWNSTGDSVFVLLLNANEKPDDGALFLVPTMGGTPRRLADVPLSSVAAGAVVLSPDARHLVWNRDLSRAQTGRSDIYITDVLSGRTRALVEHPAVDELLGWLPGTNVVLFTSDRSGTTDLWSVRVANGRASAAPQLVRTGLFRSGAIGFASGAFFYTVQTGWRGPGIVGLDPRTGSPVGAVSTPLRDFNTYPRSLRWSPDGQSIAGVSQSRGRNVVKVHSMATGSRETFWMDAGVNPLAIAWAPDGKSLYVRATVSAPSGFSSRGPHQFLRLDLVRGTTTRLPGPDDPELGNALRPFLVTADNQSLLLGAGQIREERHIDEMALVLRSVQDGSERVLYQTAGFVPDFHLSADGAQLAFVKSLPGHADSLFVLGMDGAQPARVVSAWRNDEFTLLGWMPAGDAFLTARLTPDRKSEELVRVGMDGSVTVVGTSPFTPERGQPVLGHGRSRLTLAPSGTRLTKDVLTDELQELWRMDGLPALFAAMGNGGR